MPTLRPQTLSGLVVIPTVESEPGLHRVSIAINVGQSRTPPPDPVTREDLVVELRNASEGALEPIASPDPGPLPLRAIRVVQARGEFTFAGSVNPPDEVSVALRGDRKSFPLNQPMTPTKCLGREPQEGGSFGPTRRPPGSLIRFPLPQILPFKRSCSVRRLEVPLNSNPDPTVKNEYYDIEADFAVRGRRFQCRCCEYRQFVRGTFTDAGGAAVPFIMPSGPLDPSRYCEDGSIDEFGAGKHGYYGHRATSSAGDKYGGAGKQQGCVYRGTETPACPPAESAHLEFLGLVIDVCQASVVAKRTWTIDL